LGQKVCRDRNDDKFIEAALAAGALTVISRDHDQAALEKPLGIAILTPRAWLRTLSRAERRALE
jgi:predicted nucleic acid-binding protein